MTVNKAILVGNLGADPESRQTSSGSTVTNLRIATNERRKDAAGEWNDHTEWHRVVCFGRTAENAAKYLNRGRRVYVEGRISSRKWTDKEGRERYTTEVVCDQLHFLGGQSERGQAPAKEASARPMSDLPKALGFDGSEIPF
jgi:single-strand DNA-binding protein